MNCSACDNGSFSKRDRTKGSTCEDCFVDNSIMDFDYTYDPCDCHRVGHNKSKLKKIPDIEELLFDDIKDSIVEEKKQHENALYHIKQNEKLLAETKATAEIEVIEQRLKELRKLQRDKDIGED